MNTKGLTLRQAAELTGKSVDTLRRYYRDGRLPGAGPRPGDPTQQIYIPLDALVQVGLLGADALAQGEPEAVLARKAAERERDAEHDELVTLRAETTLQRRELNRLLEEHDRLHRLLASAVSWADAPAVADDGLPVQPLFGSALFPPRLWLYINFHCNLACDYCSVASSPQARRRSIGLTRFRALVDEAVAEGFTELYVTGGEPFLEPDIVDMLLYATDRLDVVCLTNAMLYRGRRREQLARLAARPRLTLQTSLDGATAATHDVHRGTGSWAKAMAGLDTALGLGLPVRVGMTETPENADQIEPLRRLLAGKGIRGRDFAVRPLVARGFSTGGVAIGEDNTVPELTVTADGWHWHPASADIGTSPDKFLGGPEVPMAEAKRRAVETFLTLRQGDGSLPLVYNCAV
ncbi:MAG: radical SAM protein [Motilibacteraceae bacterium]